MHGDHPAGLEVEESARGIGRVGMDVAELRWIVSANREEREFGSESAPDFAKASEIGGVAGMIDGMFPGLQDKAAVATVRVFENARSPVARGNVRHRQTTVARTFPPVEFDDLGEAEIGNQVGHVRGDDDGRRNAARA